MKYSFARSKFYILTGIILGLISAVFVYTRTQPDWFRHDECGYIGNAKGFLVNARLPHCDGAPVYAILLSPFFLFIRDNAYVSLLNRAIYALLFFIVAVFYCNSRFSKGVTTFSLLLLLFSMVYMCWNSVHIVFSVWLLLYLVSFSSKDNKCSFLNGLLGGGIRVY